MATPYVSREGKRAARQANRRAGRGGWKKRTLSCHGVERGCAYRQYHSTRKRADVHLVLHHQRAWPTSQGEKADDGSGDTDWCTLQPDDGVEAPSAYGGGRARARVGRAMTAFRKGRLQGLSCLKGNFHEQFLGGWAGAIPPGYPAKMAALKSRAFWRGVDSFKDLQEAEEYLSLR